MSVTIPGSISEARQRLKSWFRPGKRSRANAKPARLAASTPQTVAVTVMKSVFCRNVSIGTTVTAL
jgi:hypothetical protein